MRWLFGITNSMDENLGKLREMLRDREASMCCSPRGCKVSGMTWQVNNNNKKSNIVSTVNNDSLISSFLTWIPFIYFSCPITVSRSSNTYVE